MSRPRDSDGDVLAVIVLKNKGDRVLARIISSHAEAPNLKGKFSYTLVNILSPR